MHSLKNKIAAAGIGLDVDMTPITWPHVRLAGKVSS
jgi:hypothetical protein